MSNISENLRKAVSEFVTSCGRDYEFPAGGRHPILIPSEDKLLRELKKAAIPKAEKVLTLSEDLDSSDCYSIVIFGVRLAILGVRDSLPSEYECGVLALASGSPRIDSRDVLGALAIFENCSNRLVIDFRSKLEAVLEFADHAKLRPTVDGYFARSDEMRAIEVMGIIENGSDKELTFKPRVSSPEW